MIDDSPTLSGPKVPNENHSHYHQSRDIRNRKITHIPQLTSEIKFHDIQVTAATCICIYYNNTKDK